MRRIIQALLIVGLGTFLAASPVAARPLVPSSRPTGNLLVLLDQSPSSASAGRSGVLNTIAAVGGRFAGKSVPEIGLLTVRPPAGTTPAALAGALRRLPGVASVEPERRYSLRLVPNDAALHDTDPNTGIPYQWALAREGFYTAWNIGRGDGATVAVIDTGVDSTQPDLKRKLAALVNQQSPSRSTGPPGTDQIGHGTHVASLACADTNNGIGIAGAGFNCKLVIEKSDLTDSSIEAALVDAAKRHVDAINMSFGPTSGNPPPPPRAEVRALHYAAAHNVVLVGAAADTPGTEQGDPANILQPKGTGADLNKGIGLDVTAADHTGRRASFAGYGSEISLAAFGLFDSNASGICPLGGVPFGIVGAYPGNFTTEEEQFAACRVTLGGDDRYALLGGTSQAAPQVAAAAAMMRVLDPFASATQVIRLLKQTAQRPGGKGWTPDLGWGVLDAGAAMNAVRRIDPPVSRIQAPATTNTPTFILRISGHDLRYRELIPSPIAYFLVYVRDGKSRFRLLERTARQALSFHGSRGHTYTFYSVAVDRAGNREQHPTRVTTAVV